jgi:hypothetical protein
MVNAFDSCTDSCGWTAAFIAALAYGSFGVPVKATKHIDVHPLMLQSYKTLVVFVTCWFVTLLGVQVGFTKWGLLSGLLWVVGGTGGMSWSKCESLCLDLVLDQHLIDNLRFPSFQEFTVSEWLDWLLLLEHGHPS